MPKDRKVGTTIIDMIKGPLGFVMVLFVTLVLAGMSQFVDLSDDLESACETVAAFFVIYMIIWVLNYLR